MEDRDHQDEPFPTKRQVAAVGSKKKGRRSLHESGKSSPLPGLHVCPVCLVQFEGSTCDCRKQDPSQVALIASSNNSSSIIQSKFNLIQVPDAKNIPRSETKSGNQIKTPDRVVLVNNLLGRNECLIDKEAVLDLDLEKDSSSSSCSIPWTASAASSSSHLLDSLCTPTKQQQQQKQQQVTQPETPRKQQPAVDLNRTPDHREYTSLPAARHSCPYCQKTFRSNGKLNNHVFSHTGERPFDCHHCHKAFSSKFKLVRHLLIHSKDRKFLCTVCERRFLRNDHLKNHYKVHAPRKTRYRCLRANCDKEYSSALSQRKHEAWHRAQDGDTVCLLCNVKQETAEELLLHLKSHSGSRLLKAPEDRKFRCHVCDRNFLTRKDVTRHLVVHTGERDFLCQFCPQRFGRKDHLVRHINKAHTGPGKKKIHKSIMTLNKLKKKVDKKRGDDEEEVEEQEDLRGAADLFEGASKSLMFSEPSYVDAFDDGKQDLLLAQENSSGELLKELLATEPDAPLPGFSQVFNPCPPSSPLPR